MRKYFCLVAFLMILNLQVTTSNAEGRDVARSKRSIISEFVDKIIKKLKGEGKDVGKKCFDKLKNGEIPSAEDGDSPLEAFGYPYFNIPLKSVIVKPGATLSYMFGYRQPVKIGSRDYVIAGYPNELLAFFACFESYKIIGSSLNKTGSWVSDTGSVKIQVENLDTKYPNLRSTTFDTLFKYSMDRIIKYLNPVKIIKGLDAQIFGSSGAVKDLSDISKLLEKIKEWIPGSEKLVNKVLEIFIKPTSLEDKVSEFIGFIEEEEKRKSAIRQKWIGWDNVSQDQKMLVTLTMYEKPEHGVRSTFYTGKSTLPMGDIGSAIKILLGKDN